MESLNETDKLLSENLAKCRCCFRILIDDRRAVKITEEIRNQFKDLTQIEVNCKQIIKIMINLMLFQLLESEMFADKICQLCASDLTVFSNLRQDLVSKQKNLYELAGIDGALITQVEDAEVEFALETTSDFGMEFEAEEQDEETSIYVEEQQEEDSQASGSILEIEKIQVKTNDSQMDVEHDESTSFDFFEEIVDSVESDDQLSQGYDSENLKQEHEM